MAPMNPSIISQLGFLTFLKIDLNVTLGVDVEEVVVASLTLLVEDAMEFEKLNNHKRKMNESQELKIDLKMKP